MVGSHLLDYLFENTDWEIFGLVRWRSPMNNIKGHIQNINSKNRVNLVYGDLRDSISLLSALKQIRPDYIFHLASQSNPSTSYGSPLETLDTNILGTERLLWAARETVPGSLIHVCASSEIFGRTTADKLPIGEECSLNPASPYAISKVGTDLIGRYYADAYGMKILTTRMFSHTGPRRGDVFAESSFAKQIAMIEAEFLNPVIYVGNLDSVRTWADVRDTVRAYYLLLTKNPQAGEYYNIGGTYTCTVGDVLKHLLSISLAKDIKIEVDKQRLRPLDADLQVPNMEKFQSHTGWKPIIPFEKTMLDLLDYWRDRIRNGELFLNR
ncbi:Gmd GDP-D-mannose dehydratase [Oxalobacteraceae bacterium]